MPAPAITVTCDCGEKRKVGYGDAFTCTCGRSWSTSQIPAADYAAIVQMDRRYRLIGWGAGLGFALVLLFVLLTKPFLTFVLIPGGMLTWFGFLRPFVRRRHWREVQALTRTWKLRADRGAVR